MNEKAIREAIESGDRFDSYRDYGQLEQVLRWKIIDAMTMRGQQLPESTLVTICKKVREVLLRDYPNFTDKEFELILEAGLTGKLGKETWINGAGILQWLSAYKNSEARIRAAFVPKEEKQVKKTKAEIDALNEQAFQEGFRKGFECYKKNGTIFHIDGFAIPQWPSAIYMEFRNRGVIPKATESDMAQADAKAKAYLAKYPVTNPLSKESLLIRTTDIIRAYLLEQYYESERKKSMGIHYS